jgi:hypothetical protein
MKNLGLNKELDKKEQADCEAFVSLVKSTIFPAIVSPIYLLSMIYT